MKNTHRYDGVDLTGQKHERLTIIEKSNKGKTRWIARCECGKIVDICASKFFNIKSCGCLEKENLKNIGKLSFKHGMANTILYGKYCSMKQRCHNQNYKYYARYGGRGIKICEEWDNSFEAFAKWAYENGYDESKKGYSQTLDRIDTDKDYCPENCKWSNQKEQVRNRSNTRWVIYNGEKVNPYDFAEMFDITNKVFIYRHLDKGESGEEILAKWNRRHHKDVQEHMNVEISG